MNDFLWHGQNKLQQLLMCAPMKLGGLNILHVKNVIHALRVKWVARLTQDIGLSWSQHIWQRVVSIIPHSLIVGARGF